MPSEDTLFENQKKKILNNKFVVPLLIAGVVIGAFLGFTSKLVQDGITIWDTLFPRKEIVKIGITVQPFNLISGSTNNQRGFKEFYTLDNDVNVESVSSSIVSELLRNIQPRTKSNLDLEIIENKLRAFEPVTASISYYQSPIQSLAVKEFDEKSDLNLEEYFQYTDFYNPACNCIKLYIVDRAGQLKPVYIEIYKNGMTYSFDAKSMVNKKILGSEISPTVVFIEPFILNNGTKSETGEQVKASLDVSLREKLSVIDHIKISDLTKEELDKRREVLEGQATNGGKPDAVDQYNADFVVGGNIYVTDAP